jgi:hypothetical protein
MGLVTKEFYTQLTSHEPKHNVAEKEIDGKITHELKSRSDPMIYPIAHRPDPFFSLLELSFLFF